MTNEEKLARLAALPICAFRLEWNEHRLVYAEARSYEPYQAAVEAEGLDWDADVWSLAVHPRTPVVSHHFVGNDLGEVLDAAIAELEADP